MNSNLMRPPGATTPELDKIRSPLASNPALREMIQGLESERARLDALPMGEASVGWDALGGKMDALAKYLDMRAHLGGFDAWDFEAAYLNDKEFRSLFESDREWLMREWLVEDLDEMIEAVSAAEADSHAYSRTELRNLVDVLKHIDDSRAEAGRARLERLLNSTD